MGVVDELRTDTPRREDVEKYLNLPDVQHKLGIPKGYKYTMMTPELGARFFLQQDWTYKTWEYVAELLERGVRVLNVSSATRLC